MEIPVRTEVECTDGPCGRSTYVVVDPTNRHVTHVVVRQGGLFGNEHMVAVEHVKETSDGHIKVDCTKDGLAKMKPFVHGEHLPGEVPYLIYEPSEYMTWPYVIADAGLMLVEHDHVPAGELAVSRGTPVEASDGKVGRVDELVIDPQDRSITHLVVRAGHWWGQKDLTIPVSAIDRIADETVYLKLDRAGVDALPAIPVRRASLQ
jgi:sporulation protein YlmC with PRC-barrel domain